MKKIISIITLTTGLGVASAQQVLNNVETIVTKSSSIIGGGVTGLLMGVTFAVFLFSIITFLLKRRSGDDKGLQDAKNMLGWSVIAMFVMVAIWGLVTFICQTFNIGLGGQVARPEAIPVLKTSDNNNTDGNVNKFERGFPCTSPSQCINNSCTPSPSSPDTKTCD